jgi:hypothetical protein
MGIVSLWGYFYEHAKNDCGKIQYGFLLQNYVVKDNI